MSDTNPAPPPIPVPEVPTPPTALATTPPLVLPAMEVESYHAAPPERRAEIDRALTEIDITDSNAILFFGSGAQEEVTAIADEMLEGVRNKDTGAAGQSLNDLVTT